MNRTNHDRARALLLDAHCTPIWSFLDEQRRWYIIIGFEYRRFNSVAEVRAFLREGRR